VTGLKAKSKYYVRMRICKKIDGKNEYSTWSNTKTIVVLKKGAKVTKLTMSSSTKSLRVGESYTRKITISPAYAYNKEVSYTSSNKKVATVNESGEVTAKAKGTATITVKTKDGSKKKVSYKVKVTVPVNIIKFPTAEKKIEEGSTYKQIATIMPSNATNKKVTYTSSNKSIATVDKNGKVTAKAKGTATITVKTKDGTAKTAKYTVKIYAKIKKDSTKFIAHRGLSDKAPENTVTAFELAGKADGFWGMETDVRVTQDKKLVLFHDDTLERMCGDSQSIESMTFDEVRKVKITNGNNYELYKKEVSATRIPTLEEYLQVCKKYNLVPMIEIKYIYNDEEQQREELNLIYTSVKEIMGTKQVIFTGFQYSSLEILAELKNENGDSAISFQWASQTVDSNLIEAYQKYQMAVEANYKKIGLEEYQYFKNQGVEINLWTINDKAKAADFIDLGVDYIITNKILW
jgi:glycerophosphoryl diester phosphodiesterase